MKLFTLTISTLFFLLSVFVPAKSQAQCEVTGSPPNFNGSGNGDDQGTGIAVDNQNNYYVTGYSQRGTRDMVLIKYNINNDRVWERYYNGTGSSEDVAVSCAVDNANNVYVAGTSAGTSSTGNDIVLIKYNTNGNELWTQRYSNSGATGAFEDRAWALKLDGIGNPVIIGTSAITSSTDVHMLILKYNSAGNRIFSYIFRTNQLENNAVYYNCLDIDVNNNIYGACDRSSGGNRGTVIVKLDENGSTLWNTFPNEINLGSTGGVAAIRVDNSTNNIYLAAAAGSGTNYITLYKYIVGTNQPQWTYTYTINSGFSVELMIDPAGDVYLSGNESSPISSWNISFFKFSSSSNIPIWKNDYNTTGAYNDYVTGITNHPDLNKLYLSARTSGGSPLGFNFCVLSIDKIDGSLDCEITYTQANDGGASEVTYKNNSLYICGYENISVNNGNIKVIRLLPVIPRVTNLSSTVPTNFRLYQNYPNPFNPSTKIRFDILKNANVYIKLYDVRGVLVRELVNSLLLPGTYELEFEATSLPSGIYFYTLSSDNYFDKMKMAIIK